MAWEVGDLALRVRNPASRGRKRFPGEPPLTLGTIYTVAGVVSYESGVLGLVLVDAPQSFQISGDWCADSFRKIQPYQERFARELEVCKPINSPVSA